MPSMANPFERVEVFVRHLPRGTQGVLRGRAAIQTASAVWIATSPGSPMISARTTWRASRWTVSRRLFRLPARQAAPGEA